MGHVPERRWRLALRLQLKPGERVLVGGAVVRNGSVRAELFVESGGPVLREPDVLRPNAVRTPCERVYLALQLMYVDHRAPEGYADAYRELADEVLAAAPSCAPLVRVIDEQVVAGELFKALRSARRLIAYERELLAHAS
jgi:flagellar protein FlbT